MGVFTEKSPPALRKLFPAAAACLAILALSALRQDDKTISNFNPLIEGQNLVFALGGQFTGLHFHFPSVTLAVLHYDLPAAFSRAAWAFAAGLPLLLACALGALLHSLRAGLLAAAILFFFPGDNIEQALIASSVLLALGVFSLPFRNEPLKSLLLGFSLGAALQTKGVTVPPMLALLAAHLFAAGWRRKLARRLPAALAVCAALTVWAAVNRTAFGNAVLLTEKPARAGQNICAGALGLAETTEGDFAGRALCPAAGGSMALWAAGEMARHPVRTASAFARRLHRLYFRLPGGAAALPLTLAAFWAAYALRRKKEFRPLTAAAFYFFLLHLLMPVEAKYFYPAWCLFAVLAAAALAQAAAPGGAPGADPGGRLLLAAGGVPLAGLWLFSTVLLAAYPARARRPSGAEALSARHPSNVYLHLAAGESGLNSGEYGAAARHYRQARELTGDNFFNWKESQAAFFSGTGPDEGAFSSGAWSGDYPTALYYGLRAYERGEPARGDRAVACALQLCLVSMNYVRQVTNLTEYGYLEALRRNGGKECAESLRATLQLLPGDRGAVLERLLRRRSPELLTPEGIYARYRLGTAQACAGDPLGPACLLPPQSALPGDCRELAGLRPQGLPFNPGKANFGIASLGRNPYNSVFSRGQDRPRHR